MSLRTALLAFVSACVIAGIALAYLIEGGPLWFAIALAAVMLAVVVPLGWRSYDVGDRLGRDWRRSRSEGGSDGG